MSEPFWADPAATRPRPVDGGIRIHSTRGSVADTWWSGRFLTVLESGCGGGRLARGRAYARRGQIVSLQVGPGSATALVQGSAAKPYRVRIGVRAFDKAEWARAAAALAADAFHAASLLAGEMPREIEDLFAGLGLALFPAERRDLTMDCTCPDAEVPCKHLAAAFYLLAERFDADPFTVLALRGRDRETLLDDLRGRRARAEPTADLDGWFLAGPLDLAGLAGPSTPADALLDQLPEFPIAVRGQRLAEVLRPLYRELGEEY